MEKLPWTPSCAQASDMLPFAMNSQHARSDAQVVTAVGLRSEDYGTHSLRRGAPSIITQRTGNLRAMQILLGHTKIETTVWYLGVDMEDPLSLSEATEI